MADIRYTQVVSGQLTVEKLPDGSTAILDQRSKNVHSLNVGATVAWEACKAGATLADVRRALELRAGAPVDETVALSALSQLHEAKLVDTDAPSAADVSAAARRSSMLRWAVGLALPAVLTLALSQQRAQAQQVFSQNS